MKDCMNFTLNISLHYHQGYLSVRYIIFSVHSNVQETCTFPLMTINLVQYCMSAESIQILDARVQFESASLACSNFCLSWRFKCNHEELVHAQETVESQLFCSTMHSSLLTSGDGSRKQIASTCRLLCLTLWLLYFIVAMGVSIRRCVN